MSHWTSNAISAAYATFRPHYPPALFAAVAKHCTTAAKRRRLCVDVGCGTGQAAISLLDYFDSVVGVDPSATQVAHAPTHARATYAVASAETFASFIPSGPHSADCVTVAQAIHWFDLEKFMGQVDLTLKQEPGALLAFWSYPLCTIVSHPQVDALLRSLDAMLMSEGHWPPERRHVDNHYAEIWTPEYFPDDRWHREVDSFSVEKRMLLDEFVSYLSTMSGVDRYLKQFPEQDILGDFHNAARAAMSEDSTRTVDGKEAEKEPPTLTVVFNMETYFASRK
jgi:SAM-dependent methyltransferase